ncbi:acyl-protein synthase [Mixta theicola]|uniref:Acyl-protein synthase n=1 Tax=Mixta theicola TaxID=1458355 RepID=A0A2K1QEP6_9GAMM|nr:acyl-protein synthase [Mixta theicola]PNS13493.1 acyl-protein synthase [Mixta theicola]GLR09811.1 acyl-protein synthetase [Mixta theicola]
MTVISGVDALCAIEHPYQTGANVDQLFDTAMREIVAWHVVNTPGYSQWLAHHGIKPDVSNITTWSQLPPVFANYFKKNLLLSQSGQAALELTSSGTTGQKSRMRYDERSISAAQGMVDRIFRYYGWENTDKPCNYLLLSYEPADVITLGTSYTDQFLCKYAPVKRAVYALRHTGKGHEFDLFGVIRALQEFAEEGAPVRIFGFPAFMWFVLERMREMQLPPLKLHSDSLVFFGGGWKTHADKEIPKSELYARLTGQLGIWDSRCRDGYGAVEHCVPYVECSHHRFHLPVYARAWIRDTRTFEVRDYGQRGFLQFVSPYITSCPAHSIVMSDLAVLHCADECECELQTDWFELLGRASNHQARSCALAASELIQEK